MDLTSGEIIRENDIDIKIDFYRRVEGFDFIKIAHVFEDTFNKKNMVLRKGVETKSLSFVEQIYCKFEAAKQLSIINWQ